MKHNFDDYDRDLTTLPIDKLNILIYLYSFSRKIWPILR